MNAAADRKPSTPPEGKKTSATTSKLPITASRIAIESPSRAFKGV